ncbi:MAG: hypothetical protein PHP98_03835 [Kiritimatiellae bacterium]|nr:hypothetical protein [Kiritimatiellia bacterium]
MKITGVIIGGIIMAVLISPFGGRLPPSLRSGALFYLPVFLAAWLLLPAVSRSAIFYERLPRRMSAWAAISLLTIVFALTGLYWTASVGAHSGDEGHYLILIESLRADGDLDIRNNLENEIGEAAVAELGRSTFHISPFARGARWHSLHPAGLPFLLAPFAGGGAAGRHLALGLIAALTVYAVWRLCRMAGASPAASFIINAGFFGSLYGICYASRCLPEMLGAGLIAWLCWCIFAQEDWPWTSAVLAGFCCAFMPWAHLRFYPPALLGVLFYGAAGLRAPEPAARKTVRLAVFLGLATGGIVFHQHVQDWMYEGGAAHAVSDVLFSYPPGLWCVFTKAAGLLNVFPLAIGLIAAACIWLFAARGRRGMAMALGAMFGAVWLTSCGGENYFGGATLGGRFLFAVMPLFLPAAAVIWDRAAGPARWWLLVLAMASIGLAILELIYLPQLGRSFIFPYNALPVAAPLLAGLPPPFCGIWHALAAGILTLGALGARRRAPAAVFVGLIIAVTLVWQIAARI